MFGERQQTTQTLEIKLPSGLLPNVSSLPAPGTLMCCSWMHSITLFSARLQPRRYSSVDIWNCHNCKVTVTLDGHHTCELRIRKEISFQNINQKNSFQQEIFLALIRAAQEPELSQKLSARDGESHPTPEMMTFCIPATRRHLLRVCHVTEQARTRTQREVTLVDGWWFSFHANGLNQNNRRKEIS